MEEAKITKQIPTEVDEKGLQYAFESLFNRLLSVTNLNETYEEKQNDRQVLGGGRYSNGTCNSPQRQGESGDDERGSL